MKKLTFIIAVLFTHNLYAQNVNGNILWNGKELKWENFQGTPEDTTQYGAATSSWIESRYFVTPEKEIHFVIAAWFSQKYSWVAKGVGNSYILSHEQYHFTLTELYARKIRKALSEMEFNESTYQQKIPELFYGYRTSLELQQKRYDAETNHDKDGNKQQDWTFSIREEMRQLKKFANTEVVIKLH